MIEKFSRQDCLKKSFDEDILYLVNKESIEMHVSK